MDISRLKGQEHIKRALEIATTGNHSMLVMCISCYDDGINFLWPIAQTLNISTNIRTPCPCGNFGSAERTCTCSDQLRDRFYAETMPVMPVHHDMYLEMHAVSYEKLTSDRASEPHETVMERITRAKAHLPKVSIALDAAGQSLMKAAVRQLAFSQWQYEQTLNVAHTISALAGAKAIGAAHIAEAVQYRPRASA